MPATAEAGATAFRVRDASLCVNFDQCNLRCVMCWTTYDRKRNAKIRQATNLSRRDLLSLLRSAEFEGLDSLSVVGGGEPFLYPEIDDLLREGPTETRRLMVMTHGGLLHRNATLWEVARRARLTMTISVDAATARTYEAIRVRGRWTQLVANIERLVAARAENPLLRVNASFVVLRQNLAEVLPFLELCAGWGVEYVHFHPAIAGTYPSAWRVDRSGDEYRQVMARAYARARAARIALDSPAELLTPADLLEEAAGGSPAASSAASSAGGTAAPEAAGALREAAAGSGVPDGNGSRNPQPAEPTAEALDPRRECRLHTEAMTVNHLGDVYVCDTAFRVGYRCGNVLRDGVAGAWHSAAWSSLRAAHAASAPESHPLCSRCLLLR